MKYLTLYTPSGSGGEHNEPTITYKDISDFKVNGDSTISFKTAKGVKVTTPLFWRLKSGTKEQLEAKDAPAQAEAPAAAPRAGNRGWGR